VIRQIVRFDATVHYALALDEDGIAASPGGP